MKLFVRLFILLIVVFVILYFSLGRIIKAGVEEFGPKILGVPVTVDHVGLSPISGEATIHNLIIGNPEGFSSEHALKFDEINVELSTRSLFSDTVLIRSITVEKPSISYEVRGKGSNIKAIENNIPKKSSDSKDPSEENENGSKKVIIKDLYIVKGKVHLALAGAGATLDLPKIHLQNIGEKSGGTSFKQAAKEIISAITGGINKLDFSGVTKKAGEIGKGLKEGIEGIGGKLKKGLFGN